jgi:hypothetical protein
MIICVVLGLFLAPGAWFDRRAYKPADRNLMGTGTSGTLRLVWLGRIGRYSYGSLLFFEGPGASVIQSNFEYRQLSALHEGPTTPCQTRPTIGIMTPRLYQSCDNDNDGVQHFYSPEALMLLPVNPVITSFQGLFADCEAGLHMLLHDVFHVSTLSFHIL